MLLFPMLINSSLLFVFRIAISVYALYDFHSPLRNNPKNKVYRLYFFSWGLKIIFSEEKKTKRARINKITAKTGEEKATKIPIMAKAIAINLKTYRKEYPSLYSI
jgi:hypothetical protein